MADELKIYKRKISNEEAQGQYIMVLKNALSFFPKIGKSFKLKIKDSEKGDEQTFDVAVIAVSPHAADRTDADRCEQRQPRCALKEGRLFAALRHDFRKNIDHSVGRCVNRTGNIRASQDRCVHAIYPFWRLG